MAALMHMDMARSYLLDVELLGYDSSGSCLRERGYVCGATLDWAMANLLQHRNGARLLQMGICMTPPF